MNAQERISNLNTLIHNAKTEIKAIESDTERFKVRIAEYEQYRPKANQPDLYGFAEFYSRRITRTKEWIVENNESIKFYTECIANYRSQLNSI